MRRTPGLIALLLVLAGDSAAARARPDFTGTWRIDVERSADATADRMDTWIVRQTADTLALVDADFPNDNRAYRLDGSPTTISNPVTGEWTFRTRWEGDRLVITSEGDDPGRNSMEIWWLDTRGELVIEWHRRPTPGHLAISINYYRKIAD